MQPENAWQVNLDEEEQALYWTSSEHKVHSQPARHFFQRISECFYCLLPVENQLQAHMKNNSLAKSAVTRKKIFKCNQLIHQADRWQLLIVVANELLLAPSSGQWAR